MNTQPLLRRMRQGVQARWRQLFWKLLTIILLTGSSTFLIALVAAAALNAVSVRGSADAVEKQVKILVQIGRSISSGALGQATGCTTQSLAADFLRPVHAYLGKARVSLATNRGERLPDWLPQPDFAGLIVDRGQLEIRSVASRQQGDCVVTAIFTLPLEAELARRISSVTATDVVSVAPHPFHVHALYQRLFQTIETNFLPGLSRPISVVLAARDWQTGKAQDWVAFETRPTYFHHFADVTHIGTQLADWVKLLTAFALAVLLMNVSGIGFSARLGLAISRTIDSLSDATRQIAAGKYTCCLPAEGDDQLNDLLSDFNRMGLALERLRKEEAAKLRLESELQVAESVQQQLFPRVAPRMCKGTVQGKTLAARTIGGDLYDFIDLGDNRTGVLCADVAGKGIPAALMMANLQAVARAYAGARPHDDAPPAFVERLSDQLAGRFGGSRYATLFWAEYNACTGQMKYVNAGHPPPILVHSSGIIERPDVGGLPAGMFPDSPYSAGDLRLEAGSRLILFTDGVTDALNPAGDQFGEEHLLDYCRSLPASSDATAIVDGLVQAVEAWSAGAEQFDDTTVVVIAA